jgi:DNA-binding MarR family transcriptional regulator
MRPVPCIILSLAESNAGGYSQMTKTGTILLKDLDRKLGYSGTALSKKLGVSQPSVSISVKRGEQIA